MGQFENHILDWDRAERTGIPEVVLAASKSNEQIVAIATEAIATERALFFTRLGAEAAGQIDRLFPGALQYNAVAATAILGEMASATPKEGIAIIAGGTSDLPVAQEASETLRFLGYQADMHLDIGVAGLWRLMDRIDQLRSAQVIIAVAGMEGALFSVVAGLVPALVIAVPVSVGYGVARDGSAALHSALASCAPGIVAVNIDNGFGAAVAAVKILAGK